MRRSLKWVFLFFGAACLLVLAIVTFLVVDFPGRSTDHLVKRAASPDGRIVAELHEVVAPMHGGPDRMSLTLNTNGSSDGEIVHSERSECGPDFTGYDLRWQSAHNLLVVYKSCDANSGDTVQGTKRNSWRDVEIKYQRD